MTDNSFKASSSVSNPFGAIRIVFNHAQTGQSYQAPLGNLGQTSVANNTYRMQHYCTASCQQIQFLFGNSAGNTVNLNDITVKASCEDSAGNIYPLFFNGQPTVVIKPGAFVLSDKLGIQVQSGDYIWTRTFATVVGQYSIGEVVQQAGEGFIAGDFTGGGLVTVQLGYAYVPLAIYGQTISPKDCVAIVGDSITKGNAVTNPYNSAIVNGFGPPFGNVNPHVDLGLSGNSLAASILRVNTNLMWRLLDGCSIVLCQLGINDFPGGNVNTMIANATSLYTYWRSLGLKVWQTTLTPKTTSTDGWTTAINQTVTGPEPTRLAFNAWIRNGGAGLLSGVCDVEFYSSQLNGSAIVWKNNYTADGLHPSGAPTNQTIFVAALANLVSTLQ